MNPEIHTEKMASLPLPDFEGFPLDSYFVPVRILPYLATRGCYWGRCTFCDHGQGYFDQYRGLTAQQVVQQVKALKPSPTYEYELRYNRDPAWTADMFVEAVYKSLAPKR